MNARYYVGEVGRFASADTLVPDPQNPQSFNRFAYVNNNPLKYTDPSGHGACTSTSCDIMWNTRSNRATVRTTEGSALYQLIARASHGYDTAKGRLDQLLDETRTLLPGNQFGGIAAQRGDYGFQSQFRDDHLYGQVWGIEQPASRQVGHFLTAVKLGSGSSTNPWNTLARLWLIVRHEQFSDTTCTVCGVARQLAPIRPQEEFRIDDLARFSAAASADANGNYMLREALLMDIIDPERFGPLDTRIGNSMQDLRLSARGWYLGQLVNSGGLKTNQDLTNWLALNIAGE